VSRKVGAALGVVGIVLVAMSFAGPWWSLSMQASALGVNLNLTGDFGLFGGTTHLDSPAGSQTQSVAYGNNTHIGSVFALGAIFMFLGIVLGAAMVAMVVGSAKRPNLRKPGAIVGLLAFALALLGPLYVMVSLPAAINADSGGGATEGLSISGFFGSQSTDLLGVTLNVNYGGGWGWYLALVGAIIFLVAAIASMRVPRSGPMASAPMNPYPQAYQQPYQQPPYQQPPYQQPPYQPPGQPPQP
jgi:hypothetical protein